MTDETKIDPKHGTTRAVLRTLGPVTAGIGLLLIVIGTWSFFASFGDFEPPRYFWCAFLGMPLLFAGLVMCQFGFYGSVARYVSGEVAPVQRDTFNYLAEGTQEGVRNVASAIGEGLAEHRAVTVCPRCGHRNDAEANFCSKCGATLANRNPNGGRA